MKRYIWGMLIGGALLFAASVPFGHAHNTAPPAAGESKPACTLSAHGDIQCPADPEASPGRVAPADIGEPSWTYTPSLPPPGSSPVFVPGSSCKGQDPMAVFREHARVREGYSTKVYEDSLGKPTVGIGHLVTEEDNLKVGDEISPERVDELWKKDSAKAFSAAVAQAEEAGICDGCFVAALASVNYQLGTGWRTKFPERWQLIKDGKYAEAADGLENTLWYKQTPVRVRDFQAALRALPPKTPNCEMQPPIKTPPDLCTIAPETCKPICYGDLCHCKMEMAPQTPPLPLVACDAPIEPATVNPGNFSSALSSLSPGKTIVLAPGSYPAFSIKGRSLAGAQIRCAEPGKCIVKPTVGIENSNGVTLEGFSITGGGQGFSIIDSQNIMIRCSNFTSQTNSGILVYGTKAANIQLHKNNFRNEKTGCSYFDHSVCGGMLNGVPRPEMDYGIRAYYAQSLDVRGNTWEGIFSHGISLKMGVKYANISDNTFGTCGRYCVQLGQEPNTKQSGYRSNGTAIVDNNTFLPDARWRLGSVMVMNTENATVTNNKFAGPGKPLIIYQWPSNERNVVNNGIPPNRQYSQSGNEGLDSQSVASNVTSSVPPPPLAAGDPGYFTLPGCPVPGPGTPGPTGPGIKLCLPSGGNAKKVCGSSALQSALASAKAGDRIQLCAGSYGGTYTYSKKGASGSPIIVEAEPGAVVNMGSFRFTSDSSYGVLKGVRLSGGASVNGTYNRVTGNVFSGSGLRMDNNAGPHAYNRIDYNEFKGITGEMIRIDVDDGASKHPGHRIDHNYFHDHNRQCGGPGQEAVINFWTDHYSESGATIDYNLFENVLNGPDSCGQNEIISAKTSGMTFRGNTFFNVPGGRLTIRQCSNCVVDRNYFGPGVGGININGDNHVISCNKLEGGDIQVGAGDGTSGTRECSGGKWSRVPSVVKGGCKGVHAAAQNVELYDNIGRILVGKTFSGYNVPARGTKLRNNTGGVSLGFQTDTNNAGGSSACTAAPISKSAVGPQAADADAVCSGGDSDDGGTDPGPVPADPAQPAACSAGNGFALNSSSWVVQEGDPGASAVFTGNGVTMTGIPPTGDEQESLGGVAIWSTKQLTGNWNVSFDYTQLDNNVQNGSLGVFSQFYFGMQGTGGSFPPSPACWKEFEPTDHFYGSHAKGMRISLDTRNVNMALSDEIRLRNFPGNGQRVSIDPESSESFPFEPNTTYRVRVSRTGSTLTVTATAPDGRATTQKFSDTSILQNGDGYVAFRVSEGKSASITNLSMSGN